MPNESVVETNIHEKANYPKKKQQTSSYPPQVYWVLPDLPCGRQKPGVLLIKVVLLPCKVTGTEYKYADKLTLLKEGGEGRNGVRIYFSYPAWNISLTFSCLFRFFELWPYRQRAKAWFPLQLELFY